MTNYYQILGIERRATSTQIRAAYKRMAMAYHPDHNPGNDEAEELFKLINEAYHILSDSLKKAKYDELMFPQYHRPPPPVFIKPETRSSPRRPVVAGKYYKIDKEYYKHQGLSLLVYIVLAGFCFAVMNGIQYFVAQKQLTAYHENTAELKQAGSLFTARKFDDAFALVRDMNTKAPLEFRIHRTLDSLVSVLRKEAESKFQSRDFMASTSLYLVLKKYENPLDIETMRRISMGHFYLGNYKESLEAMQQIYEKHPDNLELVYSMAVVNLDKLNAPVAALKFFNIAKSMGEKILSSDADASKQNDFLDDIFSGSAEANLLLGNYAVVVSDCDRAIQLNPEEGETYKFRAQANAKLNKMTFVCDDLAKASRLGATEIQALQHEFCK